MRFGLETSRSILANRCCSKFEKEFHAAPDAPTERRSNERMFSSRTELSGPVQVLAEHRIRFPICSGSSSIATQVFVHLPVYLAIRKLSTRS